MKKALLTVLTFLGISMILGAQDSAAFKGVATYTGGGLGPRPSYVNIATPTGSNLRLDTSFALECRFYMDHNMATGTASLISSYGTSGGFDLKVEDKEIIFKVYLPDNSVSRTISFGSRDSIKLGQWNYVALSFKSDKGYATLVLNGRQIIQKIALTEYVPVRNENAFLRIGADGSSKFVGLAVIIDEVRIWNYTRSSADMLTFQDSCFSGTHPNLLAHYTFQGVTDQNITDQSTHNNSGVITAYSPARIVNGAFSCGNSTSVKETKAKNISVYPNPADGRIFVDLETNDFSYSLTNALGQEYLQGNNLTNGIDVSNLKPGIYFLSLNNGSEYYSQKIIKQ